MLIINHLLSSCHVNWLLIMTLSCRGSYRIGDIVMLIANDIEINADYY